MDDPPHIHSGQALPGSHTTPEDSTSSRKQTMLQPADYEGFFAALKRPAAPAHRLRTAFARHRKTVESRG